MFEKVLGRVLSLALLMPKNDETWHKCLDSRTINKTTVCYHFYMKIYSIHSSIMATSTNFIKTRRFCWNLKADESFQSIKEKLDFPLIFLYYLILFYIVMLGK